MASADAEKIGKVPGTRVDVHSQRACADQQKSWKSKAGLSK